MELDIRWPLGLMFVVLAAILAGYGLGLGAPQPVALDAWVGLGMLVFGGVMLLSARRGT